MKKKCLHASRGPKKVETIETGKVVDEGDVPFIDMKSSDFRTNKIRSFIGLMTPFQGAHCSHMYVEG